MKKLSLFLFILISVFTYAQDSTQTKNKQTKRLFIGLNFSPDLAYRKLRNASEGNQGDLIVNTYNKIDKPKFGFTTGFDFCYLISKHISLDIGIQYSNKGYKINTSNLTFGDMVDRRRGFVYNTSSSTNYPTNVKIVSAYNYVDIPLKVNFTFGKRKTTFITAIGIVTNILLNATNKVSEKLLDGTSNYNTNDVTNNFNRINLSPTISCGIQYKTSDKMFFRIEPTLRYGILKLSNTSVTQYLWNAGINLSWYFI